MPFDLRSFVFILLEEEETARLQISMRNIYLRRTERTGLDNDHHHTYWGLHGWVRQRERPRTEREMRNRRGAEGCREKRK